MTAVDPLPPLLILLRQRVYPAHNLRLFLSLCGLDFGVNYTRTGPRMASFKLVYKHKQTVCTGLLKCLTLIMGEFRVCEVKFTGESRMFQLVVEVHLVI